MTVLSLLVIDDDAGDIALISRLARAAFPNSRVQVAADALGVEAICAKEQFDCVILDYSMPGFTGLECTQRIRAMFPHLPIVMTTGFGDEMLAAKAIMTGATDYIPKARLSWQSLHRVVENAIKVCDQARVIEQQRTELEQFTYALAHDFKQPVRQIQTFASLVSSAIRDGESETVGCHIDFLRHAARRLGDLVDVMSQYTLLGQTPQMRDVDLCAVVADILASLQPYLQERGGRVTHGDLPVVWGNEVLIGQALQNLIVNGLKYNESPTPTVDISSEELSGQCVIRVCDNGIGIEQQYVDEIFKPLFRLHNNSEYSGTGLGLALARKALGAMKGSIACESQPDRGSTFVVKVPLFEGGSWTRKAAPSASHAILEPAAECRAASGVIV